MSIGRLKRCGIDRIKANLPHACLTAIMVGVLAGCGNGNISTEPPRPVLVVQVGPSFAPPGGAGMALSAYAGEVRAREESTLAFRVGGKVLRRRVDAGDRVRAGDVLAELDPADLRLQAESLSAQLGAAEAGLARTRADHARIAALAKDQLVSRSNLDQQTAALRAAEAEVRAARAQLDVARNQAGYSALRAPRDGVIASRHIEAGQVLSAGEPAFALAGDSGREIAFALPESRIREVAVGLQVIVELWSAPGQRWPGRIREIAAAADPQARTFAARATLDGEAANAVDLGQSARVYIVQSAGSTLDVPLTAVQTDPKGTAAVWVADPKAQRVRRVPVRLGPFGAERVPVLSGLNAGDYVVVAGGHLLQDGQAVLPVDRDNRPVLVNAMNNAAKNAVQTAVQTAVERD
jgi:membrane fusion protein, multidrug efflux system